LKVHKIKFAAATLICAALAIPSRAFSTPIATINGRREFRQDQYPLAISHRIAQAEPDTDTDTDNTDEEDKEVPPAEVDKYINVNVAMQKDHNLTVEQAASKQGMTVAQFRTIEGKIERDDTLRERVRTALRKATNPNATDSTDQ
jgi:hypothetical protein